MQMVSLGDNFYEMSSPLFMKKKKNYQFDICLTADIKFI